MEKIITNIGEQSDGSLVLQNGEILTPEKRQEIITNSLSTPIRIEEEQIKNNIRNNTYSILISPTGSGKTTEYGQMIHEIDPNARVQISIPLVASTIGSADYVAFMMYVKTGNPEYLLGNGIVGYRTGRGNSEERRTQISFETYGISRLNLFLGNTKRKLLSNKNDLHIFLDEIHELGSDFIFLLNGLRFLMKEFPGRVKLVLGSATIPDNFLDELTSYLKKFPDFSLNDNLIDLSTERNKKVKTEVSVMKIDGRTFPIELKEDNGGDAIEHVVEFYKKGKSVLCFQPGKAEIAKTIKQLQETLGENIEIFPFHSEISQEELEDVLKQTDRQIIIIATNAAQTGVTLAINAVVNPGIKKSQYYDQYGIPILLSEDITKDEKEQIDGRGGRTEKGFSNYIGRTESSELKKQSPASIEIKVEEMDILKELADGRNILKDVLAGKLIYLKKPNIDMLHVSYEWMKRVGLITKNEKITKLGFEVTKLPVSAFNGRIILEAIENGVAYDIVNIVSILENKGFMKKEFNITKFSKNFFSTDFSDFDLYVKLFDILSSKQIDDNILNIFVNMGIDRGLINYFKSLDGTEKFYKVIGKDIEEIGIKYKALERTDETNEKLKERLENNQQYLEKKDILIENGDKRRLISKSLLAGSLHRMYSVIGKKELQDYYKIQGDMSFEQSNTSYIDLNHGGVYIGAPFIIGGNGEKDDKNIMSFLTTIEVEDIEYFESKEYKEYKIIKEKIDINDYSVDTYGDTFEIPSIIKEKTSKQKYLAKNWLPYFLIKKNPYFINFLGNLGDDYEKDLVVQQLKEITTKFYGEIDSNNKDQSVEKFGKDKRILEVFAKKYDSTDSVQKDIASISKENNTIPRKSDFYKYVEANNSYNKVLDEAAIFLDNLALDTQIQRDSNLLALVSVLEENSSNYSNIILFLNKLNENKNNKNLKSRIKNEFISLDKKEEELLKIKKKYSWLRSFTDNLDRLSKGEDISTLDLSIGIKNNNDLFLSDPIISKTKLFNKSDILQVKFRNLDSTLSKIDSIDFAKISKYLQKLLFVDKRKAKRSYFSLGKELSSISNVIEQNNLKIINLKKSKISLNSEKTNINIRELNILNNKLYKSISAIKEFRDLILDLKVTLDEIDLGKLIFCDIDNKIIYDKKYLSNIVMDKVFYGNFTVLSKLENEKLDERLKITIGEYFSNAEINEIVFLINNLQSNINQTGVNNQGFKKAYNPTKFKGKNSYHISKKVNNSTKTTIDNQISEKVGKYISLFRGFLKSYRKQEADLLKYISGGDYSNAIFLKKEVKGLMLDIFDSNVILANQSKIYNFSKKIYNLKIEKFDENLIKFLTNLPLEESKILGDTFSNLSLYEDGINYIEGLEKINDLKDREELIKRNNDNKEKSRNISLESKKARDSAIAFIKSFDTKYSLDNTEIKNNVLLLVKKIEEYKQEKLNPKNISSNFNSLILNNYLDVFANITLVLNEKLDILRKNLSILKKKHKKIKSEKRSIGLKKILNITQIDEKNKELAYNKTNIDHTKSKIIKLEKNLKNEYKNISSIINMFHDIFSEIETVGKIIDVDNIFDINEIKEKEKLLKDKVIGLKYLFEKITN